MDAVNSSTICRIKSFPNGHSSFYLNEVISDSAIGPFNLHLDFWNSRSASNLRKFLGPPNQNFFQGLHLESHRQGAFSHLYLEFIQKTLVVKDEEVICVTLDNSVVLSPQAILFIISGISNPLRSFFYNKQLCMFYLTRSTRIKKLRT